MTRITASTFEELLEDEKERFEKRIDQWLVNEVLPSFRGLSQGWTTYLIEDDVFISKFSDLIKSLHSRGFIVNNYYGEVVLVDLALPSEE